MAYEKLTYSGSECNNYFYFSFYGDSFDEGKITKEMELTPTKVRMKGNPFPKNSLWKFKIELGKKIDFETPLREFVKILKSKTSIINALKKEYSLQTRFQFVIDIDIDPDASTPYFGLNKEIISFLSETNTEVDFDLYKVDSTGILD